MLIHGHDIQAMQYSPALEHSGVQARLLDTEVDGALRVQFVVSDIGVAPPDALAWVAANYSAEQVEALIADPSPAKPPRYPGWHQYVLPSAEIPLWVRIAFTALIKRINQRIPQNPITQQELEDQIKDDLTAGV